MFSLRDLRFVLCSRDLGILRAQRIIGIFNLITHNHHRAVENFDHRGHPEFSEKGWVLNEF